MKIHVYLALFFVVLSSGCTQTQTNERVPTNAAKYFRTFRDFGIDSQNWDYLGSETAFWVTAVQGIEDQKRAELGESFRVTLGKAGFFPVFLDEQEVKTRLSENRLMQTNAERYLANLNTVTVSDKDYANPLGKFLAVDDLLVMHIARWPCATCDGQQKVRIKVRLVDAESGLILWTATAQRDTEPEDSSFEIAQQLTDDLAQMFIQRFEQKWHKLRYLNLNQARL